MISKRDLQLGKIALKAGMVTKDQITRCLALKKKLAAEKGKKVSLGALLIKKGYLTEAQLEELVKLHNEQGGAETSGETSGVASAEASGDAPKKKRKKKKKKGSTTGEVSSESTATATSEAPPSEAPSEAPGANGNGNGDGSQEAVAELAKKKGDTGRTDRSTQGGSAAKRSARAPKAEEKPSEEASGVESAVESNGSDVDPAVFQSAPESAVDEEDRRLIACPECGKKYRVRPVQQGKRFTCRRCKNKVKVPKDLFDRPLEKAKKKKSKGEVAVEEFTLGSSDQTEEPEGAPKASARTAAVKAAVAIQKVQAQASIADLARAAAKAPKKGLPPRRKFGVVQALTLLLCIGAVVGIVGGVVLYKKHLAALEEQRRAEAAAVELDGWKKKVQELLDRIEPTIKAKQATDLGSLLSDLKVRVKEYETLARGDNRQQAEAWIQTLDLPAKKRAILVARADALWRSGTTVGADESLLALGQALDLNKDDDDLAALLGRRLIQAGKTAEAAERLNKRTVPAAAALAGLAFERGGAAEQAAQAYQKLPGALGAVLAARARLGARDAAGALSALEKAGDAAGPEKAAAKMVEAQAHMERDEFDAAKKAVDEAIAAAKDLPWPKALEGELLLRHGEAQAALAAFQAANQVAGTARGFLGIGDAQAALLDLEAARRAWNEASAAPVTHAASPLAPGDVDPFEAPMAPDPRALARCRLGALDAAAGRSTASDEYTKALAIDPFCIEAEAGLAILDVRAGNLPFADGRLQGALLRLRLQGGAESDVVRSPTSAAVLVARGFWLIASGRPKEAGEALQKAAEADPEVAPQATALKGPALEGQGLNEQAYGPYQQASQLEAQKSFPANLPYLAALKLLEEGAKDAPAQEKVLAGVTATLALNPWHARAYLLRGRVLVAQGKAAQALPSLGQAIALNGYLREAYVTRGFLYVRDLPERERTRETAGKAAEDFQKAQRIEIKQGGEKAETHRGLALVAFSQNNLTEAHDHASKAIQLDAQDAEAYRVRAQIRTRQGNPTGAKEDTAKADQLKRAGR